VKLTFSSLVLLATAAFFWITIGQGDSVLPLPEDSSGTWTESYLDGAERWSYDETGHRNQHLTLGTAKTYHGDPVTYLNDLVFSGPDDKGRYWEMSAQEGRLRPGAQELILSKGVKVHDRGGEATLTTPRLRLLLAEERAVNDVRVRLTTKDSITTARGMDIDLKSGTARLLRDVETNYGN